MWLVGGRPNRERARAPACGSVETLPHGTWSRRFSRGWGRKGTSKQSRWTVGRDVRPLGKQATCREGPAPMHARRGTAECRRQSTRVRRLRASWRIPRSAGGGVAQRGSRRIVFIRLDGRCAECPSERTPRSRPGGSAPESRAAINAGSFPSGGCRSQVQYRFSVEGWQLPCTLSTSHPRRTSCGEARHIPCESLLRSRSGRPSVLFRRVCTICSRSATGRRELP
jgi:hypothetical protein